ncbi:putative aspartic protease [Cardamine amara subsp. amara]|uniref:Aspartic protease n=1 Tax=Cardamine amara subsp. amara TaxID=228776 RepID=A0ABD1AWI9_CARAN
MATPSLLFFFFLSVALSTSAHPKHFTIELIHRDSPLSPLYNPQNTATDRLNAAFLRSISRSRRFNHQTDLQSGLTELADAEYFMSITIGTPPVKVLVLADTGSDLIWVQCKPCQGCYGNGTIFDKKKSSTYKNEPCNSHNCNAFPHSKRVCDIYHNVCNYDYKYGDGSFTIGDVATETISIDTASGSPVSFPGISFGCGYNNDGIFENTSSGIIGLGGGKLSLISQLSSSIPIPKKLSYCLSHKSTNMNGKSFINLGTSTIPSGLSKASRMISTPLVIKDDYYYLTLEAISVGKTKIPYTGKFSNPKDGGIFLETKGNIIIDSGTPLTHLDSGFFRIFGAAVEESVTGAKRVSHPNKIFSHCFKPGNANIRLPEITVHFTRADVRLSETNAFVKENEDMVCLGMIPTTEAVIYGAYAQMDFFVGYDLESRTVSFQRIDCSANL